MKKVVSNHITLRDSFYVVKLVPCLLGFSGFFYICGWEMDDQNGGLLKFTIISFDEAFGFIATLQMVPNQGLSWSSAI